MAAQVDLEEKYSFVKEIPAEFRCLICSKLSRNPHKTECCRRHSVCQYCLEKWSQSNWNNTCPFCRRINYTHRVYFPTQRKIDELKVHCPYRANGCRAIPTLKEIEEHIKNCEFDTVRCSCGVSLVRGVLREHQEKHCPKRIVRCRYCQQKGQFKNITSSVHQRRCPDFPINCPNGCHASGIKRKNLKKHRKKCSLEVIKCFYSDVGCDETMYRKDFDLHLTRNTEKHLQLTRQSHRKLSTKCVKLKQENSRLKKENKLLKKKAYRSTSPGGTSTG